MESGLRPSKKKIRKIEPFIKAETQIARFSVKFDHFDVKNGEKKPDAAGIKTIAGGDKKLLLF